MKNKISTLKKQGNDNVIDVESMLFMEKSVVLVITTFYVLSAMIYIRYRQINIDLCDPLIISIKPIFFGSRMYLHNFKGYISSVICYYLCLYCYDLQQIEANKYWFIWSFNNIVKTQIA
jgi:hypothetical protein